MERVKAILEEQGLEYELIEHEHPVRSAKEGAALFGIDMGQTAPVLIAIADDSHVALILSGKRGRISFQSLAAQLGYQSIRMTRMDEVKGLTGYEPGSIPLIGHGLPVILDEELFNHPEVYGGSGHPTWTLKLTPQALEKGSNVIARLT
ncbi:hypothetical protein M4D57_05510 [Brevibacillus borstelensis]|uniref:aminoacyl-tRNA deacylase n=1 Tax=Brevibacillus borstelensis TaxID=45462 RepID=UPI00204171B8|nr:YbaK/EbsC family protein [Brevibacillus borstelensis]MCM3558012.1 hypothetical protein [Brevibacillus borstelensis]MCM3592049.1 hypothetical protein [Brevibacillus borstelensis]MED1854314.1 YbaK/EbsC family protein [Brevibacillus borstelensis]